MTPLDRLIHTCLWPLRVVFILALAWVTKQMLTDNPVAMSALFWDKLLHIGAWGFIVGLGYLAYQLKTGWCYMVLAIFAYSVVIEVLQPILANREFSVFDILANAIGCITAGKMCPILTNLVNQKLSH